MATTTTGFSTSTNNMHRHTSNMVVVVIIIIIRDHSPKHLWCVIIFQLVKPSTHTNTHTRATRYSQLTKNRSLCLSVFFVSIGRSFHEQNNYFDCYCDNSCKASSVGKPIWISFVHVTHGHVPKFASFMNRTTMMNTIHLWIESCTTGTHTHTHSIHVALGVFRLHSYILAKLKGIALKEIFTVVDGIYSIRWSTA